MKIHSLIVTTFALTLSLSIAEETQVRPPPAPSGVDPFKDENRVTPPPELLPFAKILADQDRRRVIARFEQMQLSQDVEPSDQNPQNPFGENQDTLSFCYEDFSLPLEMMADIQQKQLTDAALYDYVRKSLGTDPEQDPVRREIYVILRAKSGFPAKANNYVSKGTSQVGYRIELEYSGAENIDLRFSLNNTIETDSSNGAADGKVADKPLIHTESIEATVSLSDHTPYLIGTVNRAASSKLGLGSTKRVLLGFITASPVK